MKQNKTTQNFGQENENINTLFNQEPFIKNNSKTNIKFVRTTTTNNKRLKKHKSQAMEHRHLFVCNSVNCAYLYNYISLYYLSELGFRVL